MSGSPASFEKLSANDNVQAIATPAVGAARQP